MTLVCGQFLFSLTARKLRLIAFCSTTENIFLLYSCLKPLSLLDYYNNIFSVITMQNLIIININKLILANFQKLNQDLNLFTCQGI